MKRIAFALLFAAGCSSSPTAPTPPPIVPVTPPVVVSPPVSSPSNPLLSDPRFNLSFYRDFALGVLHFGVAQTLRRHSEAPFIYLMTVDQAGASIDAGTIEATAAALINTTGALTGTFGLEGLERGRSVSVPRPNQITIEWATTTTPGICGEAARGGNVITLYYKNPACQCGGLSIRTSTVKHELGHALGFSHTDSPSDLMYSTAPQACDKNPSAREVYHAAVAYSQPIGSLDPQ